MNELSQRLRAHTRHAFLLAICDNIESEHNRNFVKEAADDLLKFELDMERMLDGQNTELVANLASRNRDDFLNQAAQGGAVMTPQSAQITFERNTGMPWGVSGIHGSIQAEPTKPIGRGLLKESVLAALRSHPCTVEQIVDVLGSAATGDRNADKRRVRSCLYKMLRWSEISRNGDIYSMPGQKNRLVNKLKFWR